MIKQVNIHEAKTHLSRLVDQAAKGESFIIAKAGKPMVRVVPVEKTATGATSRLGFLKGQIKVPDDFDTMHQEEIIRLFEGDEGE